MKCIAAVRLRLCMLGWVWASAACGPSEPTAAPRPEPAAVSVPAAAPAPEPEAPPRRLFARKYVSKLRREPTLDAQQLGYLRAGTVLTAKTAKPVGHDRCLRGWYEIAETGGFVCDGREVIAFDGSRTPDRVPTQADRTAPLPYRYAYNRVAGTPMYKRLPLEEEALFWEDGVLQGDAGMVDQTVAEELQPPDAGAAEPENERPATLAELSGERGALVRRRLAKGFHVSLDRDFETGRRRYWRTLSNGYIPYERMVELPGSSFHGVASPSLPLAAVRESAGAPLSRQNEKGRLVAAGTLPFHAWFEVAEERNIGGLRYLANAAGELLRADRATHIEATPPPKAAAPGERWIDIDLDRQTLIAYEGEQPVYVTLISSGRVRHSNNPLLNHETPVGEYRILSKHTSATMDGDHAIFGAYSLEDVPYVQFFKGAYALHGAFWHDRFGRPSSHGCINLAPEDARWLFDWTAPEVPRAWHAAYPLAPGPKGTLLVIRGTTPRG
jgi:hypothetical protein